MNWQLVKFATWNLQCVSRSRTRILKKVEFMRAMPWDVIALQEVTIDTWETIKAERLGEAYLYAFDDLEITPVGQLPHGAALIARNGFSLDHPNRFPNLPRPERGLGAVTRKCSADLAVASWHAPNASGDGVKVKMAGYQGFIDWLNSRTTPTIAGFDGNHWERWVKLERQHIPDSDDPWLLENQFFGSNAPHRLRDAFIEYLKANPTEYTAIIENRPEGPLEVSYVRKNRGNPIPERMDYILVSQEVHARTVFYHYDASVSAGSDHGLVTAELRVE